MIRLPRFLIALAWFCTLVTTTRAHPYLQNTWRTLVESNRLVMRVTASLREVAVAQSLNSGTNQAPDLEKLLASLDRHSAYLLTTLRVEANGQPLTGEVLDYQLEAGGGPGEPPGSPQFLDLTHATFDLEFRFTSNQAPRLVIFGHKTLQGFNYAPGIPWDVTYLLQAKDAARRDLAAGLVRSDLPYELTLPAVAGTTPAVALPAEARMSAADVSPDELDDFHGGAAAPFSAYLRLGIHHIVTGWDHLLFLAALALGAVKLRDFFKLIAIFTAAHSLTVTLSALDWVRLPPWFVEPVIALSIVFIAVENLVAPRRAGTRARDVVAFAFGLVHGLGFAGGLNEALGGTGGSALAAAVLAFCLGVELGHLGIGLPFWSLIRTGRAELGEAFGQSSLRWGSALVSLGGGYFFVAAVRNYL